MSKTFADMGYRYMVRRKRVKGKYYPYVYEVIDLDEPNKKKQVVFGPTSHRILANRRRDKLNEEEWPDRFRQFSPEQRARLKEIHNRPEAVENHRAANIINSQKAVEKRAERRAAKEAKG
jgi:hypothetical protein